MNFQHLIAASLFALTLSLVTSGAALAAAPATAPTTNKAPENASENKTITLQEAAPAAENTPAVKADVLMTETPSEAPAVNKENDKINAKIAEIEFQKQKKLMITDTARKVKLLQTAHDCAKKSRTEAAFKTCNDNLRTGIMAHMEEMRSANTN